MPPSKHHRFAVLVAVLLAALGFSGCKPAQERGGDARPVIGVSLLNLSSEFIVLLRDAMEEEAGKLGVRLIINDAERSADKQVRQVESFVAQKVSAIILNPCEVEASAPAVERAVAAGIPIVNVNSETRASPTAFVGSRDEESGKIAMEFLAARLKGQGRIAMMHGFMGQAAQIKRDQGAREVLKMYPGLVLAAEQTAEWDRAKAVSLMENWIQAHHGNLQAIFAQNDEMAMGAVIALEQAGLKSKTIVVGVDAIADALQAVKDGRLDATVFQDAKGQGATAVQTAAHLARGEPVEKEVFIPFKLVTRENVEEFLRKR